MDLSKHRNIVPFFIPLLFALIYFPVFSADYAYLDEIHQLWYNRGDSNFKMFHTQGRWLSGLIFQELFASITTIEQIRYLRILSFAGWVVTGILFSYLLRQWIGMLALPTQLVWLGSLYVVCSIPVAVYIGWASCVEVFLAVITGLLSGHWLYLGLQKKMNSFLSVAGSLLLGITTLFLYQAAFGVFLLPFFLHYFQKRSLRPDRVVVYGILIHLLVYGFYYLLFKQSLQWYDMEASTRTAVNINLLSKLSFFFAGPVPQGFSLNFLFSARSIFSQLWYPVVIIVWLVAVFKRNRHNPVLQNIGFIAVLLAMLAIIYLPLMIASEDFPSYRTLFAFNLAVFLMVMDSLLYFITQPKHRQVFTWVLTLWLVATGFYAFHFQYIRPLKAEYHVFKNFMLQHFTPAKNKVVFVRADKFLFTPHYHTMVYRDELGAPSTYRDWVPEPIVKQMVFQITGNREAAATIEVRQFENMDAMKMAQPLIDSNTLLINMNDLFHIAHEKK